MPTYSYQREDGTTFDAWQRITDAPLESCPDTGQPVRRIIAGGAGLIFKGSGFYLTDYARKGSGTEESGSSVAKKESSSSAGTPEKPASTKSDSK